MDDHLNQEQDAPMLGRNPCMVNGRTTTKSYLVAATRKDVKSYNAVGIKKIGGDRFKFHLWPNARALGLAAYLEERHPGAMYSRAAGMSACEYTGVVLDRSDTEAFLDYIKEKETLNVAKRQHIMDVLDGGCQPYGGCVDGSNIEAGVIDYSDFDPSTDEDDE